MGLSLCRPAGPSVRRLCPPKRFEAIYGKKEESPDIKQDGSEQPANRPKSK